MHVTVGSLYLGLLVVLLPSWMASLVEAAWLLLLDWRFGGGERIRGRGGGRGGEGESRSGMESGKEGVAVVGGRGREEEKVREGIRRKRGKYLLENKEDLQKFPFNNHVHSRRDFSLLQDLNIENGSLQTTPCHRQS